MIVLLSSYCLIKLDANQNKCDVYIKMHLYQWVLPWTGDRRTQYAAMFRKETAGYEVITALIFGIRRNDG